MASESQIQPLDLKIARENSPSHVAKYTQILTDARPEEGGNTPVKLRCDSIN